MESNNIDKLFKDKLSSEEVEFNPAAWTAAEEMIAQQYGKTVWYTGKVFLSLLAAAIVTLGGAVWLLSPENSTSLIEEENISFVHQEVADNVKPDDSVLKEAIAEESPKDNMTLQNAVKQSSKGSFNSSNDGGKFASNTLKTKNRPTKIVPDSNIGDKNTGANKNLVNSSVKNGSISTHFKINIQEKEIINLDNVDLIATEDIKSEDNYSQPIELPINDRGLSILRNFDFRLVIGGGVAWGFRNPQLADPAGIGYSPTAGFNIGYIANSEFSFKVNVLYRMRTGLSYEALMLPVVSNDVIVAQSLHYLDVPFYLNYHFDRHSVQFGMQYSYLIATRLETTNSADNTSTIGWGKTDYFKNNDLAALIGYNFMLNEQLNIGARFNYGIFDVTGNQPSAWETNDKNLHLNFLLEYKLSKY